MYDITFHPSIFSQFQPLFSVVERVKALGWEEELSLLSNEQQSLENLAVVIEACETDLTERGMA